MVGLFSGPTRLPQNAGSVKGHILRGKKLKSEIQHSTLNWLIRSILIKKEETLYMSYSWNTVCKKKKQIQKGRDIVIESKIEDRTNINYVCFSYKHETGNKSIT